MTIFIRSIFLAVFLLGIANQAAFAKDTTDIRLYRLDCGSIGVSDLNVFSDTYAYVGQAKQLVASCYLIKHNDKWMMWDAGLPQTIHSQPDGVVNGVFTLKVNTLLSDQLDLLDLNADDIDYLGLSHTHFDHTGAAHLLQNATLLVQKSETDFIDNHGHQAAKHFMDKAPLKHFFDRDDKVIPLQGDHDVFGDGSVVILSTPGHTPGHQSVLINLPNKGPVVLSGDQWHFIENYKSNGVPSFNYSRKDTLASSNRLKKIIKNLRAELIIQHEPKHIKKVPVLPKYLD